MKNFIIFLAAVFLSLFLSLYIKQKQVAQGGEKVLRVFANTSFLAQWGPGPWLKEEFEKTCNCKVEFFDGADSIILFQRLKAEGRSGGADVVLSLDQYDIELAQKSFEWRKLNINKDNFFPETKEVMSFSNLLPYDWGVLAFVARQKDLSELPTRMDDLLDAKYKGQIAIQDPRTSSPGLQFLLWLIYLKGEDQAFEYIKKFNNQAHSYSTSWSQAYALFTEKKVKTTFSYVTSPVYHQLNDKDSDIVALPFEDGHPIQYEFVGVPSICRECDLAESFVALMLSREGQKVIMEKNFMYPVIKGVKEGTPFANVPKYKTVDNTVLPTMGDRERILKKWASIRRGE